MDRDLLTGLIAATADSALPAARPCLHTAAAYLAMDEPTALAWGQVLTEHTAPAVDEDWTPPLHVFEAAAVSPEQCARCGDLSDAPLHRVEVLTNKQRDLLEDLLQTGPRIGVSTSLVDLGFAEHGSAGYVITPRGRAWLEAHPREGGERE